MIVEDQVYIGEDLRDRLKRFDVLGPFTNGMDALKAPRPDLAILDIDLSDDMTGMDVAEQLNKEQEVPVIFLTKVQDDQNVYDRISAFNFPVYYISKPVSTNELLVNVKNALGHIPVDDSENQIESDVEDGQTDELGDLTLFRGKMLLRNGNVQHSIDIEKDIIYATADGVTTLLYTTVQKPPIVISTHLKDFLTRIREHTDVIVRTSRSNAINIQRLKSIVDSRRNLSKNKSLILDGTDQKITLSVRFRHNVMNRFDSL